MPWQQFVQLAGSLGVQQHFVLPAALDADIERLKRRGVSDQVAPARWRSDARSGTVSGR